jgi:hypothetical protein
VFLNKLILGAVIAMSSLSASSLAMGQQILDKAIQANQGYGDYEHIQDMAAFVEKNKPMKAGTKEIQVQKFVVFDAVIKTTPEKQTTDYLHTAMAVAKVNPVPKVEHMMFVEVAKDTIIPVYVTDEVVNEFNTLAERYGTESFRNKTLRFAGIHVYNYAKGPALVIESMAQPK